MRSIFHVFDIVILSKYLYSGETKNLNTSYKVAGCAFKSSRQKSPVAAF